MQRASALIAIVLGAAACNTQIASQPDVDAPTAVDDAEPPADADPGGTGVTGTLTVGTPLVTADATSLLADADAGAAEVEPLAAGTVVATVFRTTPSNGYYHVIAGRTVGWVSGLALAAGTPPAARTLDTSVVKLIVEPPGSGVDDHGTAYTDSNYWNFCAPGAVTGMLSYFTTDVATAAGKTFSEPYGPHVSHTYWTSDDTSSGFHALGRAYLMHVALEAKPPNFTRAGLPSFSAYPSTGSSLSDSRDVLNWEGSGHSADWKTFFYSTVSASGLTKTKLHNDVKRDIYGGHALLTTVDTHYLPNWSRSLGHSIAIIGYDDTAGTYTYIDTCGKRCNGSTQSKNGGTWTISQSAMFSAITSWGSGYAR